MTIEIQLTKAQQQGLDAVRGDVSAEQYIADRVSEICSRYAQQLSLSQRAARQAAFDSLPEDHQALVGAIILKMPTAAPEVQAEVIEGAAKIAAALGIDTSALVNVKAAKIQSK